MVTAILLTLTVGCLWSLVGVFYKLIAQYKLSVFNISGATNLFSLLVLSGLCVHKIGALPEMPAPPLWFVLFMLLAGFVNLAGSMMLQRSMIYGRSGVAWSIGQSSLAVPFVSITLIFGEVWSPFRLGGTALVLTGLLVLSFRKEADGSAAERPQYGIALALGAFGILGIAQSMMSASSYLPYGDPADTRPVFLLLGGLTAILAGKYVVRDHDWRMTRRAWLIVALMALEGVTALYLQFRALDLLKQHGMNSIFFPVAVGTSIALYSIWSMAFFREKPDRKIVAGTLAVLAGIALYCLETAAR